MAAAARPVPCRSGFRPVIHHGDLTAPLLDVREERAREAGAANTRFRSADRSAEWSLLRPLQKAAAVLYGVWLTMGPSTCRSTDNSFPGAAV